MLDVHILGDGPHRARMEHYCKEHKITRVTFHGWVTKDKMIAHYQSAHVQVISSLFEGMSIAALEALSSGLFLICTKVSGMEDLIKDGINGNFIPFKSPLELSNAIKAYQKNMFSKDYQVPSEFLTHFRNEYSWPGIARQYLERIEQKLF